MSRDHMFDALKETVIKAGNKILQIREVQGTHQGIRGQREEGDCSVT